MRELVVAWVGRPRQDAWEELCADYRGRIARQVPIRDLPIRARHRGEPRQRLQEEGRALLAALPEPCWLVALDRRGRAPSSMELAKELTSRLESWPHAIAFAVGSDLGLDPSVLDRARQSLSLSRLTLPHQLARLLLYEQLYRALFKPSQYVLLSAERKCPRWLRSGQVDEGVFEGALGCSSAALPLVAERLG